MVMTSSGRTYRAPAPIDADARREDRASAMLIDFGDLLEAGTTVTSVTISAGEGGCQQPEKRPSDAIERGRAICA